MSVFFSAFLGLKESSYAARKGVLHKRYSRGGDEFFRRVTCVYQKLYHNYPKTNMAPENGWLGDYFHFGKASLKGLC